MRRPKVCPTCGEPFMAHQNHPGQRFCSRSCGHRHGAEHPRHNGGLSFSEGRWIIYCRDGTRLRYARGVMAAEIGRLLRPDEIVHHINEDSTDDRPENLEIVTRAEHADIHREALDAGRWRPAEHEAVPA